MSIEFSDLLEVQDGASVPKTAFAEALKNEQDQAHKFYVGAISQIVGIARKHVSDLNQRKAELEKALKDVNSVLEDAGRAFAYADATSNVLPVATACCAKSQAVTLLSGGNIIVPDNDDPAWQVPKDWVKTPATDGGEV